MSASTSAIREQWTQLSPGWEQQRHYLLEASRPLHTWLIDKLAPEAGETILEIGAGAGDTGFLAAPKLGSRGKLVSTDLSPAMVAVAQRRAAELGIDNAEFQTIDAQAMPYGNGAFDGVIGRWIYMLMPDPAAGLRETFRVLKPGGRLVLAVFTGPSENVWAALPSRLLVEGGHVPSPAPGAPGILALGDRSRLEALVREAGFAHLELDTVSFSWNFDSLAAYWTFLIEITALGPAIQRLTGSAQDTLRRRLTEQLAPFRDGERISLPARCWVGRATA